MRLARAITLRAGGGNYHIFKGSNSPFQVKDIEVLEVVAPQILNQNLFRDNFNFNDPQEEF